MRGATREPYTAGMRTVGVVDRSEFEPDACKAWRRARALDAMLLAARPAWPRGVTRGPHNAMALQDEARMLDAARRLDR